MVPGRGAGRRSSLVAEAHVQRHRAALTSAQRSAPCMGPGAPNGSAHQPLVARGGWARTDLLDERATISHDERSRPTAPCASSQG
jgi:hypothetical protein